MLDTVRVGIEPTGTAGEVVPHGDVVGADGVRVEHHHIGVPALAYLAALFDAIELGLYVGHQMDGFFEGQQLAFADRSLQHACGVVERREQIEVRARIGGADHRAFVAPDRDARVPIVVGLGRCRCAEAGVEFVGNCDVAQDVPRVATLRLRDVADHEASVLFVLGCDDVEDDLVRPVRQREHWVVRLLRTCVQGVAGRLVTEERELLVARREHRPLPFGHRVEHESARQGQAHAEADGHGERDDLAALASRVVARGQLAEAIVVVALGDGHDVPVDRALRGDRHVGHEIDGPLVELGPDLRDDLERRTGELSGDASELDELARGRVARRHHVAVGVVVGAGIGRGEPEATRAETVAEETLHGFELVGGRLARARVRTHDDAADRGVTHHEAEVDADVAVDAVEVLGGGLPVPRHARSQRLDGHAFDAGQHAQEVLTVGRVVGQRRDGEATVAGKRGGDTVQGRRRERVVPEDLCIEVGVHVDEARRHELAGGVDGVRGGFGDLTDLHDAIVLDTDVGSSTYSSGSVDDVAALDDHVEHVRPPGCTVRPPG